MLFFLFIKNAVFFAYTLIFTTFITIETEQASYFKPRLQTFKIYTPPWLYPYYTEPENLNGLKVNLDQRLPEQMLLYS